MLLHVNPLVTNGLSHSYHSDESTFILRDSRCNFSFLFHFSMIIFSANRIAPDGTTRCAASHLGLFCLRMSHRKDTKLLNGVHCASKFPFQNMIKITVKIIIWKAQGVPQ